MISFATASIKNSCGLQVIMRTGYMVCDAMTKKPITVKPETTIEECSKIMAQEHVGSLLIKRSGKLLGLITEQDIVREVVAKSLNPKGVEVKDVMVTDLLTIAPEKDIYDAIVVMKEKNIRHLPVMHKERMVGFLTLKDILKIEPQLFDLLVEKFELREEKSKPIRPHKTSPIGNCETCGQFTDRLRDVDGSLLCPRCARKIK